MIVENSNILGYTLVRSARAKNMRITIQSTGNVIVTIPYNMNLAKAEKYILEKKDWIDKNILRIQKRSAGILKIPKATKKDYTEKKDEALILVRKKLSQWNASYNFNWNTITIKNTSSRWGSCSKKGNLNFNYRIIYLPNELADYLIVHELCHLKEMNHAQSFWKLVAKTIPNYPELRKQLKHIS